MTNKEFEENEKFGLYDVNTYEWFYTLKLIDGKYVIIKTSNLLDSDDWTKVKSFLNLDDALKELNKIKTSEL